MNLEISTGTSPSPVSLEAMAKAGIELSFGAAPNGPPLVRTLQDERGLDHAVSEWSILIDSPNMVALFHFMLWNEEFPDSVHFEGEDDLDEDQMSLVWPYIDAANRYRPPSNPLQMLEMYRKAMLKLGAKFDPTYASSKAALPNNCVIILYPNNGRRPTFALAVVNGTIMYPSDVLRRVATVKTYIAGVFRPR